jgi:hypothetical protein
VFVKSDFIILKNNNKLMSLEHLFYSEFPPGIRYMCVDGKKIYKQEFLELKKRYFKNKKARVES